MARRWTEQEERTKYKELSRLYIRENKTIGEIGSLLRISPTSVYDRLIRLNIPSLRARKLRYNNQRNDIIIPKRYSVELAECVGFLLGDGSLNPTQVTVTLGKKDEYAEYVREALHHLFGARPKVSFSQDADCTVYLGSTKLVRWFLGMGLVFNKVKAQVDVPAWILSRKEFMRAALRGLFDTDGSIYRLRWGLQISFCNRSRPLIQSVRRMLQALQFHPSQISGYNLYLTRKDDIDKFLKEVGFKNGKHAKRFLKFTTDLTQSR